MHAACRVEQVGLDELHAVAERLARSRSRSRSTTQVAVTVVAGVEQLRDHRAPESAGAACHEHGHAIPGGAG